MIQLSKQTQKKYIFLKLIICLNPIFFSLFVILTGFIDYKGVFESGNYINIAQNWLNNSYEENPLERLPLYPLFIAIIFKIFGNDNLVALIFAQSILGSVTFYYLIKTLEKINISESLILILTLLLNLSIIYRFSVFLPNCLFVFLITMFLYNCTNFFYFKKTKSIYLMSLFIFLMMLTRPIFQLSIFFTIPIIVIFILKQNFQKDLKIKFILILILSYFLSAGVQFMRYYNKTESISYSTQSGFQLIYWVIPCLSQKYGCGSRNMEVHSLLRQRYENQIAKKDLNEVEANKIAWDIGMNYFLTEMNKIEAVKSAFFSYSKLLFHPTLTEIYPSFDIEFKNFSAINGDNFEQKFISFLKKSFSDIKYFLYMMSLISIFLLRIFQLVGIFSLKRNSSNFYYILTLISLILVIITPAIGIGNPRYRSEIEVVLIILGAFCLNKFLKKFQKKLPKNNNI